ncbi:MAG: tRNA (N6-isopentenyl adenosine(37)-C2)-methylthiotransferase MiaB [Ruminococcaceae bacterium]|nr:tRNA (N6-isopentenyl adenosine(37)-C2)-methylthiotransferase MiaB [Oscillospiraceae bacterium]
MNYTEKLNKLIEQKFNYVPLVNVQTFGCVQNENDSEKIRGILNSAGFGVSDSFENSDIVIFNTCAIRENAELKIFGNIGKLKALKANNPDMIVAVCGCMVMQPHIVAKIKKSYPFVDIVFGVNSIEELPYIVYNWYIGNKRQVSDPVVKTDVVENIPVYRQSRSKATISIMYGCDNFCSYCIVPYVRGRERSRRPEDILKEFTQLVADGYKDITLLGQNVDSYGKNLEPRVDFADLLNMLCKVKGDYVLHFMSSHPKDINKKVIDVIRDNPQISRQIHLPVQSGSNRILSLMNRRYTVEQYKEIISYARQQIPDVGFSSDIIVGFPGETYEEYLETENLVKENGFTQLFTFIYSKRKGTKAAELEDNTPHSEKTERLNRLIKIQQDIFFKYLESFNNKTVRALVEETKPGGYSARLANTLVVHFKTDRTDLLDNYVNVRITGKKGTVLTGEII